jgi:hypothetical protein
MKRLFSFAALVMPCVILLSLHMVHAADTVGDLKSGINALEQLLDGGKSSSFDGAWFSQQFGYGFKIKGKTGITTQSNSPKYKPGDVALRMESVKGGKFKGTHILTDGSWIPVTGKLVDANTLTLQGNGRTWSLTRVAAGTADQVKVSISQAATQKQDSAATAGPSETAVMSKVSHGTARNVDIVGLRIGMSVNEATNALKAKHTKGSVQRFEDTFEGLPPIRVLYGLESTTRGGQSIMETISVSVAGPVASPSVIGISRNEVYGEGKQPNRETLLQALIDKYGPPHMNEQPNPHLNMLVWYLDQSIRKPYCSPFTTRRFDKSQILGRPGDNSSCGRVLQASINSSGQNRNLISGLDIAIYDYRLAYEGITKAREQVAASADRLRAEESKRAKANKPSL